MARIPDSLRECYPETGPIRAYLDYAHQLNHTPPVLHLASIVPAVSYEMSRWGLTLPRFGPVRTWFGIVAPSGVSKTSTLRKAQDFVTEWYTRANRHNPQRVPRPWVSLDGSMPGVLHHLSEIPPIQGHVCAILYHHEASTIFRREDSADILSALYDGSTYTRHLRYLQKQADSGAIVNNKIEAPTLQAVITTTPTSLRRALSHEAKEGGLFYRFLWIHARLHEDDLMPEPTEDLALRSYALSVWDRWVANLHGQQSTTGIRPEVYLTEEAFNWLDEHVFQSLATIIVGETFEAGLAIRALPQAISLAAAYAFSEGRFDQNGRLVVPLENAMQGGKMALQNYYFAERISEEAIAPREELKEKQMRLLKALHEAGQDGLTSKQVYCLFNNRIRKKELDEIIDVLEEQEDALRIRTRHKVGRPSHHYYTWAIGINILEQQQRRDGQ